jgi:hypothetical protein
VPLKSAGTSWSVNVKLPVARLAGSTKMEYVPVAGSVVASTNPPLPSIHVGLTSTVRSGLMTLVFTSHAKAIWPWMPLVPSREMRWPAVPSNVRVPFCPGVVVVTVTDDPPGVIDPVTSAGTS